MIYGLCCSFAGLISLIMSCMERFIGLKEMKPQQKRQHDCEFHFLCIFVSVFTLSIYLLACFNISKYMQI